MKPLDVTDRRTRLIALAGLLTLGLAAGIELAAWMKGGRGRLLPGTERTHARSFLPPRGPVMEPALPFDEVLGMLARHQNEPSARDLAEAFMTEPDLASSWRKVEKDGDVPEFIRRVNESPAFARLKGSEAFGKLSTTLGSDRAAVAFGQALGIVLGAEAPGAPQLAAGGPLATATLSSGGPIRAPTSRGVTAQRPATPPSLRAQPFQTSSPLTAKAAGPAPPAGKAPPGADSAKEPIAAPPEPKAKAEPPEPCAMARVCSENTKAQCSPRQAPGAFADARRQGCACAMEDLSGLLQAPGNGALLAALMGAGGLTPLLERTDGVMKRNAQATGRCFGFRRLSTSDQRRKAGALEEELWRTEVRRQLRVFADARDVEFAEPDE